MKFSKSIVGLAIATVLFIGCKNNEKTPAEVTTKTDAKKEIVAATKPEMASFSIDGTVGFSFESDLRR